MKVNSTSIQLFQMFDNISKLRFEQGPNQEPIANAMISSEGEMIEYRQGIVAEGKVEDWMTLVLSEMRGTNRVLIKESIFHYCNEKTRFVVYNNIIHGCIKIIQ